MLNLSTPHQILAWGPRVIVILFLLLSSPPIFAANLYGVKKIDINIAPLEDLVKIIHIGEVRAKELISLRPFSSVDELIKITGIGETNLKDIKEQGLAWVGGSEELQVEPAVEESPQRAYFEGIVINEILPSPKGADAENEWIELFNQNNFKVNLTGWKITDAVGNTKSYAFPEETIIEPKEYLVVLRPITKITLNNVGDDLRLLNPEGKTMDVVNYEKAPLGKSFNRSGDGWFWSQNLTPGKENIFPKKIQETDEIKNNKEKGVAAISKPFQETKEASSENSFPLLIALAVALFSGGAILLLKNKLKINYNKSV